jgi:hypothetical protein
MDSSANTVAPTEVIAAIVAPEPSVAPAAPATPTSAPDAPAPASDVPATATAAPATATAAPAPAATATPLEALFKVITTDSGFLTRVKESVDKITKDGKVDQYDVPEIVFVISETVNSRPSFKISKELLPPLIKMLYNFIVDTHKLVPEEKKAEIERMVDSSLRLLMLQPAVSEALNRCFSFSFLSCCK